MKYIVTIIRIVVGIIFIISGFVKTVDPIGFSYKLEEYFGPEVFNISFLYKLALPLSIFFVIFEVMLGVLLLLGIWKKFTVYCLLLLIIFFSFLTFYSAYFNKVTDCGCFGDAVKLTPWTSFAKDIFLLILVLILVKGIKFLKPIFNYKLDLAFAFIALLIMCWVAYQGIVHLPLIDFRPYAVGSNIVEKMKTARELGLPETKFENIYTLKNDKTGEIKVMNDSVYLASNIWENANWKIQNDLTEQKIVVKGYEPPIQGFTIDCEGEDKTKEILSNDKVSILTIPFPLKLNQEDRNKLTTLVTQLEESKENYIVFAGTDEVKFSNLCLGDPTLLKTINRSNGGLIILKKGIVVAKYTINDLPEISIIKEL